VVAVAQLFPIPDLLNRYRKLVAFFLLILPSF
jgi:hypothetical protein